MFVIHIYFIRISFDRSNLQIINFIISVEIIGGDTMKNKYIYLKSEN